MCLPADLPRRLPCPAEQRHWRSSCGPRPSQGRCCRAEDVHWQSAGAGRQHGCCSGHQPVLLDLRNGYEWDAGHFHGAARPLEVRTL